MPLCLVVWPPLADGGGGVKEDKADYDKAIERKRRFDSDLYPPTVTGKHFFMIWGMSRSIANESFFNDPDNNSRDILI